MNLLNKPSSFNRYGSNLFAVAFFSVVATLIVVIIVATLLVVFSHWDHPFSSKVFDILDRHIIPIGATEAEKQSLGYLLGSYGDSIARYHLLMQVSIILVLSGLFLALLLMSYQMYMWSKDRKTLEKWRQTGFLCERLEFLPANRIKLNNIELELNKKQIENLKKLAQSRMNDDPVHSLDIGGQPIKRLREELGAKFVEKTLIKVRKQQGYWLEIEADRIVGPLTSEPT